MTDDVSTDGLGWVSENTAGLEVLVGDQADRVILIARS